LIAVVLVVITGVEIATSYINTAHSNLIIAALFIMAAVKFFLVAAWYMHMRTDQAFFRRVFVVGMVGAGIVYGILLLVFSSTVLKS
jgi:cytochrome c oxidase subunit IV